MKTNRTGRWNRWHGQISNLPIGFTRRCVVSTITVVAVTVASAVASSGTAHANPPSDCQYSWNDDMHDYDSILIDGSQADFGGNGYNNHRPTSSAVVCWYEDRDLVEIVGTLYNDRGSTGQDYVGLHVEFFDTAGTRVATRVYSLTTGAFCFGVCRRDIGLSNGGFSDAENLDRVRIRTFVVDDETGVRRYSSPQNRYFAV